MGGFLFPEQWLFIPGMGGFFAPDYANRLFSSTGSGLLGYAVAKIL